MHGSPIPVDMGCEEEDTESKPGFAQYHIEDRDATLQHDDTELESNSGPSAGGGPALLRGSNMRTRQQNGSHSLEGSPAPLSRMQDTDGQDESVMDERDVDRLPPSTIQGPVDASCGDMPIELVVMAREELHSTDAYLDGDH
jgi:hypothetical protein